MSGSNGQDAAINSGGGVGEPAVNVGLLAAGSRIPLAGLGTGIVVLTRGR